MSSTPFSPAAPKKHRMAQGVVDYISDIIRDGSLHPGDKLPTEAEMMRNLNVSRTVVREAMSHMQASGLVETRHGVGTFVSERPFAHMLGIDPNTVMTMHDVLAVLELRISIESEAAGLAALRRSHMQVQQLRAALDSFESCVRTSDETVAADVRFHLLIAEASSNRYFHNILSHLGTNIIPRSRLNSARLAQADPATYIQRVINEHEDILSAIVRQDPQGASAAMRTHLTNSRERLRRAAELIEGAAV